MSYLSNPSVNGETYSENKWERFEVINLSLTNWKSIFWKENHNFDIIVARIINSYKYQTQSLSIFNEDFVRATTNEGVVIQFQQGNVTRNYSFTAWSWKWFGGCCEKSNTRVRWSSALVGVAFCFGNKGSDIGVVSWILRPSKLSMWSSPQINQRQKQPFLRSSYAALCSRQ